MASADPARRSRPPVSAPGQPAGFAAPLPPASSGKPAGQRQRQEIATLGRSPRVKDGHLAAWQRPGGRAAPGQRVTGSAAQRLSGPAGQRIMPRTEAWVAQRVRPVQETPSRCTASGRGIAQTVDTCRRPAPSGHHARPGPGGPARPDGCHRKATGVPGRQDVAETACQRAPLPGQRDHRSAEPSALCALPPVPAPALPATAPRSSPAPVEGARPDPAHEVGAASHASRRSPEDPQVRSDSYSEDLPNVQFHHMEY